MNLDFIKDIRIPEFILSVLFGFILGVLIRPLIERNIVYRYLIDPIEVYTESIKDKDRYVNYLHFNIEKKEGYPYDDNICLVNKCNETVVIKNIYLSFNEPDERNWGLIWVYSITDKFNELKDLTTFNKKSLKGKYHLIFKPKILFRQYAIGGPKNGLIPFFLEPNQPIKLYYRLLPIIINTEAVPNEIITELNLNIDTSKNLKLSN